MKTLSRNWFGHKAGETVTVLEFRGSNMYRVQFEDGTTDVLGGSILVDRQDDVEDEEESELDINDHLGQLNDFVIECARDEQALATRVLISYCRTHDLDPDGFKITWEDEAYVVSIAE